MATYRIAIQASVCVTIEASTDAAALEKAKAIVLENSEGMSIDLFFPFEQQAEAGERLYLTEPAEASIENKEYTTDEILNRDA